MLRYNKYNAKKTVYNGQKYDSKKEAEYAEILDGLLKQKKILGWKRQVRFPLPDLDWIKSKSMRSWYQADFVVTDLDNTDHIVEVKGVLTTENKVKYAFFQYYYRRKINIVYTMGLNKMNTDWLIQ